MTDIVSAVHAIAVNLAAATKATRCCCDDCGCLVFSWETCPACALDRAGRGGDAA